MTHFAALVIIAVLFKLLGGQYFTPLSVVLAGGLFFLRYGVDARVRQALEIFLLQFGALIYALANQEPSYYEHAALIFCLAPAARRFREMARIALAEGTVLLVFATIVWSLAWSANTDMTLAGIYMSALCMVFLLAYVLTLGGDLKRIFRNVVQLVAAIMIGSIVVGAMGYGSTGQTFTGVTLHRNQFGFLLGLLILLGLFFLRARFRWLPVLGIAIGAAFLIYIDSKSSIISIALTTVLWFVVTAKRWRLYTALAALGVAAFVVSLPSPKMDHFAMRMGRDPTFTSRTEIWADSVKLLAEQPYTGFGYNAVWSAFENRLSQYRDAPGPKYGHAHNAWIDWGLQLGVGGLLAYILFLGVLLGRAIALARQPEGFSAGVQVACLLVYIQVYDLANVSTIPITRFGFFMLAVASLCLWLGSVAHRNAQEHTPAAMPAKPVGAQLGGAWRLPIGTLLVVAVFLGVASFAVWEDGRRFAAVNEPYPPAADAMAASSYLEVEKFQWKSADKLHEYVRAHRQALVDKMNRSMAP
jgi:exopolysaccharide production protein ExoQ